MSILLNKETKVICQGITGKAGSYYTKDCLDFGTHFVGGVNPKKAGSSIFSIPIFSSAKEAKKETDCNTSLLFVPAPFAKDAILDAIEAELDLIVAITEGIPIHDMVEIKAALKGSSTRLIGPNCPGLIAPSQNCKVGIMPSHIHRKGNIGIISRSGTLLFEAALQVSKAGLGQSTCVGIGGDPIQGSSFIDMLELFEKDEETEAILLVGEIGGSSEEQAAAWIAQNSSKPIFAYIAGKHAPKGRRMGHAGAMISKNNTGLASTKIEALKKSGATLIEDPGLIGKTISQFFSKDL